MNTETSFYLGIDLGTSACRVLAIDAEGKIQGSAQTLLPAPRRNGVMVEQNPELWWDATRSALHRLLTRIDAGCVRAIAVDGTSGTLLLAGETGNPLGPALMYNDARSRAEADCVKEFAPHESAAHGTSGGLAKLLYLQKHSDRRARYALSPADWISGRLTGRFGVSDENNCLKLGFDPLSRRWPDWLALLGLRTDLLPEVVCPGTLLGNIAARSGAEFNFAADTGIVAGTTDSTAAILASGARLPGEAVTSLGSTLVVKVIAEQPLFAPEYGIYSQRLGDLWLVGGGSNSGGAVLRHYFSFEQITAMTPHLTPDQATGLDYYPLIVPGERFPINDAGLEPRLSPRPTDERVFFQAMLEGIARIEQRGYRLLAELGAPYPTSVRSVGGGAKNKAWTRLRGRMLNTKMIDATRRDAAYGAALLALRGSSPDCESDR